MINWLKNKFKKVYRDRKDYELIDDSEYEQQLVRILTGPYKGLVYGYGAVNVIPSDANPHISFSYEVVGRLCGEKPCRMNVDALNRAYAESPDFISVAGDILVDFCGSNPNVTDNE